MRIEGSGFSKMSQVIKNISVTSYNGITLELATVTVPLPNIKVKVDGMNIELEKEDLIIAEHLLKHGRRVNLSNSGGTTVFSGNVSGLQPRESPYSNVDIKELQLTNGDLNVNDAEIRYTDEIKIGDRVIIAGINSGQTYVILDRAVILR